MTSIAGTTTGGANQASIVSSTWTTKRPGAGPGLGSCLLLLLVLTALLVGVLLGIALGLLLRGRSRRCGLLCFVG
jgi:hypothetical protein